MRYNPFDHSIIQASKDTWQVNEVPRYVVCLLRDIEDTMKLVYWNYSQSQFDSLEDREFLEIEGFEYRRYFWDECDCSDKHLPGCPVSLPNMQFDGVKINWYKYLGRGMSCNVKWNEKKWVAWYGRACELIESYDTCLLHFFDLRLQRKDCPKCKGAAK